MRKILESAKRALSIRDGGYDRGMRWYMYHNL